MTQDEIDTYFTSQRLLFEDHYLSKEEPWKQSGFSGPEERWIACRKPVAEAIQRSGKFLDVGCANGYLIESVYNWLANRGIEICPFGLDLSNKLVDLAKKRLPMFESNFFVGNSLTWDPPHRFDFVRTELCYVPTEYKKMHIERLLSEFLHPGGLLIVAEYRSRQDISLSQWIDNELASWGYEPKSVHSGWWDGKELTRIATLENR